MAMSSTFTQQGDLWLNGIRLDQRHVDIWRAGLGTQEAALAKLKAQAASGAPLGNGRYGSLSQKIASQQRLVDMERQAIFSWDTKTIPTGASVAKGAPSVLRADVPLLPHPDASTLSLGPNLGGADAVQSPLVGALSTDTGGGSMFGGGFLLIGGAILLFALLARHK